MSLYKVVLNLESVNESVAIQMKTTKQFFPVVVFMSLYKVVLNLDSVNEILKCDHLNESC